MTGESSRSESQVEQGSALEPDGLIERVADELKKVEQGLSNLQAVVSDLLVGAEVGVAQSKQLQSLDLATQTIGNLAQTLHLIAAAPGRAVERSDLDRAITLRDLYCRLVEPSTPDSDARRPKMEGISKSLASRGQVSAEDDASDVTWL